MSRGKACLPWGHLHVGQCQRAGYRNGRDDALDEVEAAIQELIADIDGENTPAVMLRGGLTHALLKVTDARA